MKRSRRDFIGSSAALAAVAATGLRPAGAQPSSSSAPGKGHRRDESCAWMTLSLAYFHAGGVRGRPERVGMARQMGVLGGVGGGGRLQPEHVNVVARKDIARRCLAEYRILEACARGDPGGRERSLRR